MVPRSTLMHDRRRVAANYYGDEVALFEEAASIRAPKLPSKRGAIGKLGHSLKRLAELFDDPVRQYRRGIRQQTVRRLHRQAFALLMLQPVALLARLARVREQLAAIDQALREGGGTQNASEITGRLTREGY